MGQKTAHSNPVEITSHNEVRSLSRIKLGKSPDGENLQETFLQELVHDNPSVIPMDQIEPAFTPMISVCRELPVKSGFVDHLWLTPDGNIILGECKLAKNPQARREVLVQALDYANAVTGWDYCDLETAIGKARAEANFKLWDFVKEQASEEILEDGESAFCSSVQRRLDNGRFVVLVILDGIQEGLESLTRFVQLHAGLHATIAIVELSIWNLDNGSKLVVPRIPFQTVLVERGVVRIDEDGHARVESPDTFHKGAPAPSFTNSEADFYEKLEAKYPGYAGKLAEFLSEIEKHGVMPEYRKSLVLRWYPEPGVAGSAGMIDANGVVWLGDGYFTAMKAGNAEAGLDYLKTVALLIGGTVKLQDETNSHVAVRNQSGKVARIEDLIEHMSAWADAIGRYTSAVNDANN